MEDLNSNILNGVSGNRDVYTLHGLAHIASFDIFTSGCHGAAYEEGISMNRTTLILSRPQKQTMGGLSPNIAIIKLPISYSVCASMDLYAYGLLWAVTPLAIRQRG